MRVVALALALLWPLGLRAQIPEAGEPPSEAESCPQGTVAVVFVDNRSIYDLDEIEEDRSFRWAYGLANRVHFDTRSTFIREELLFEEGDCYDPFLVEESERLLRRYPFLASVEIFPGQPPNPGPGDSVHVVVITRDEWTTRADLDIVVSGGLDFRGASLTELSFLGRGVTVGGFYDESDPDEQDAWGVAFSTPRTFSSRLDASVAVGDTRVGRFYNQGFFYPFVGEVGRVAAREQFTSREFFFPFATSENSEFRHALLPMFERNAEVTVTGRLGHPGNLTVFGIGLSRSKIDFPEFPGKVKVAVDDEAEFTEDADSAVAAELVSQVIPRTRSRINFLLGQRNIRFVERRGLDGLFAVQDVRVGTDITLTIGRSVKLPARLGADAGDDLSTRLDLFGGIAPGRWVLGLEGRVEGIKVTDDEDEGWRDIFGELDLYAYWKSPGETGHTFFMRAAGAGGWQVRVPFQLTLGGPTNVRGFKRDRFPGARRALFTLEDRIAFRWPFPDLFDFGLTLFGDAGKIWAGDVPFAEEDAFEASAGFGFRVGFPPGTRAVARIDASFPLTSGSSLKDVIVQVSFREVLGLIRGFRDSQIERSRRFGVGTDLFELPVTTRLNQERRR